MPRTSTVSERKAPRLKLIRSMPPEEPNQPPLDNVTEVVEAVEDPHGSIPTRAVGIRPALMEDQP